MEVASIPNLPFPVLLRRDTSDFDRMMLKATVHAQERAVPTEVSDKAGPSTGPEMHGTLEEADIPGDWEMDPAF